MANCTLNDLVPSFKCKRVFLEPSGASYSEFKIQIEGCMYDDISDENGIVDYLMSDTFGENIKLRYLVYKGSAFQRMVEFLARSTDISPAEQALILYRLMDVLDHGDFNNLTGQEIYNEVYTSPFESGTKAGTAMQKDLFTEEFFPLAEAINATYQEEEGYYIDISSNDSLGLIDFSDYPEALMENHSNKVMDEDGNLTYELLIPRGDLTFDNKTNETTVYFYAIPYFDVDSLVQDVTIPLTTETVNFFFKETHVCHILQNGIAASPEVQDFRMSQRVQEIIRPDRVSVYDEFIDGISAISRDTQRDKIGLCTDLLFSYRQQPTEEAIHTNGIFYINFGELLKRNSRHSFIYDNIYDNDSSTVSTELDDRLQSYKNLVIENTKILRLDIYRIRTDIEEYNKVRIATINTINRLPATLSDMAGFSFDDFGFRDLTYGTYAYEIDLEVVDPIYDLIEEHVYKLKYGISVYGGLIEYIHNNSQNYNEIFDALNTQAQSDLTNLIKTPSPNGNIYYDDWLASFDFLFLLFCGISLLANEEELASNIEALTTSLVNSNAQLDSRKAQYVAMNANSLQLERVMSNPDELFERRKIENTHRTMQDLMSGIDRFFEVGAITSTSSTSVQSTAELVPYSRRWNVEANPRAFDLGVMNLINDVPMSNGKMTVANYRTRMEEELELFSMTNQYAEPADLGCLTVKSVERSTVENSDLRAESFLKIYSSLLDMPNISEREMAIYDQLLSSEEEYFSSVQELKNNSGISETFLNTLGGSCENLSIASVNTDIYSNSGARNPINGIDEGRNTSRLSDSLASWTPADDEEAETIGEQRSQAKEQLVIELRKKEDLIMKFLTNRRGYSVLDRTEYKQGDWHTRRYDYNYNFASVVDQSKPYPQILRQSTALTRGAWAQPGKEINATMFRYMLDNTYMVFYMSGISRNMNPTWTHLTDIDAVQKTKSDLGIDRLICKFKRFQNTDMHIGQGSPSDREILFKYFYLI